MSDAPIDPALPESVRSDIKKIFEAVLNPALAPIESIVRDVRKISTVIEDIVKLLPSAVRFGLADIEKVGKEFAGTLGNRGSSSLTAALDTSSPSQPFYNVDFAQVSGVGTVDSEDMSAGPQFGMGVTEPVRAAVAMTKNQANGLPAFCDWANGAKGGFPVAHHAAFAFAFLDQPAPPQEAQWQQAVTAFLRDMQADLMRFAALPSLDPGSRQILSNLLTTLSNSADAVSRALDAIGRLELKVFEKHNPEIAKLLPQSALQALESQISGFVDDMEALERSGGAMDNQRTRDIRRTLAAFGPIKQTLQGLQATFPLNAGLGFSGAAQANAGGTAGVAIGVEATAAGFLGLGAGVSGSISIVSIIGLFVQSVLFAIAITEMALNLVLIDAAA